MLSSNWAWNSFVVLFDLLFSTMDELLTMVFLQIVPIFLKVPHQNSSRLGLILKKMILDWFHIAFMLLTKMIKI